MSTMINPYCTLSDFRRYITPPGQTLEDDVDDDVIVDGLIETASRRVDDLCGRVFYPHVETYNFDIPDENSIWLQDDLLQVLSYLNGDGTAITTADYILMPVNGYPKYEVQLRDTSTLGYVSDSTGSNQAVLDLQGIWGYHEDYTRRAWKQVGTLGAAWASTTTLTATMTAGHSLEARGGQILKIDTEIFQSEGVAADILTVQARGDNGSTAATHLITTPVYVWRPMREISQLTLEVARVMYRSRYGENVETTSTYTSAGVIVTPRSLPVWAQEIIERYQRLV